MAESRLIDQALRRDIHFIARHRVDYRRRSSSASGTAVGGTTARRRPPITIRPPAAGPRRAAVGPRPGRSAGDSGRIWRAAPGASAPPASVARSLRPPRFPLGGAELACLRGHEDGSRAWRSTRRAGASSAGRVTRRCGSGTRTPAPSSPASAGTRTWSRAWRSTRRPAHRQRVGDKTVRVWDADTGVRARLPPRARGLRSRAWRSTRRAAHRQRVGGQDGAGLGRGQRRGARLPPRARRRWSRAWRSTRRAGASSAGRETRRCGSGTRTAARELACLRGHEDEVTSVAFDPDGPAHRQRVVGQDGAGLGRGQRRASCLPPRARRAGSRAWRSTRRAAASSAGRGTRRCGSGTRTPAPSSPASAGTSDGVTSVAFDRRAGASSAGRTTRRCGSGTRTAARELAVPPRARGRGHERGVRPSGPAHRQRVEGQDGAGLGRGQRRGARLPSRARGLRSRAWRSTSRPAHRQRVVGRDGAGLGRGERRMHGSDPGVG